MSAAWRARATAAVLRAAASSGPASRLFAADGSAAVATAAAASATPALDKFRERLSSGPDFAAFVSAPPGASKDGYSVAAPPLKARQPKPEWMKRAPVPGGERYTEIKKKLRELKLHTVCEEAKCPNLGECWGGGDGHTATATIMLMGDTCTRACRFCAVKTGRSPPPLDPEEPTNVAAAIAEWGLDYVVLTSVDRDDLPDQGSGHFAQTIVNLKQRAPHMLVEALVPDFRGDVDCVQRVVESKLDVYAHNVETVPSLQSTVRDRRANWEQSVSTLVAAKRLARQQGHSRMLTKTSFMLGVGEQPGEVKEALQLLRAADVDVVTFGQYMRPTKGHMPVTEFVTPQAFQQWEDMAMGMGFKYAAGGPMVRSSYRAGEFFIKHMLQHGEGGQLKKEATTA